LASGLIFFAFEFLMREAALFKDDMLGAVEDPQQGCDRE
jgi:hypothetical protein